MSTEHCVQRLFDEALSLGAGPELSRAVPALPYAWVECDPTDEGPSLQVIQLQEAPVRLVFQVCHGLARPFCCFG
jgi:hypothetical protein